jgi:acyl-CoA thioester hydrolase
VRHDAWRRDAAAYPLRGELLPRYADVDVWQHLNNASLISMHGECVQRVLMEAFGPDAWRAMTPALACVASETDFLAEAYYPEPLSWGARLVSSENGSIRVASALFQRNQCVGIHEATLLHWEDGGIAGPAIPSDQRRAASGTAIVRQAGTEATEAVANRDFPALARFPWQTTVRVRFGDSDARRLASDAFLARCAEQMRVEFLNEIYGSRREDLGGMLVAHVSLQWKRRTLPGSNWQLGCGVIHMGERSLAVRGAMFDDDVCVASCDSVMVVIDRSTRRSARLPDAARSLLEPFRLRSAEPTTEA